jgi:chemotaxis protein methyltransferase CheR
MEPGPPPAGPPPLIGEAVRAVDEAQLEALEIDLLLEGIYRCYGFDFRGYAAASLRRRVRNVLRAEGLATVSGLQERLLRDPACLERFVLGLTVNVTAMFRDPGFFLALRREVVPWLRTYPLIRVWDVGCSTGEEVYSVALLLQEEGLYERSRIYATDLNGAVLKRAREGIFPLAAMKQYTANYLRAGGRRSFSEYYTAAHGHALFHPSLRENVVFSAHNLVTDGPFNEFHLILCRNVLIYFLAPLQGRVHDLLYDSLAPLGVLGLGAKESIRGTPHEADYAPIDARHPLYRRIV